MLPPPAVRLSAASLPDVGEPHEWSVVQRYLPDPSLRYTAVPFAGPSPSRLAALVFVLLFALALLTVPLVLQLMSDRFEWILLAALLGVPVVLEVWGPMRAAWSELADKARFWRRFRVVNLGLDRAVPQPDTTLRYEVHMAARCHVHLSAVHLRLVFWESWKARGKLRFTRIPYPTTEKQGHDMARQEVAALELRRGQHAVIRGTIRVPALRPTEHHRGKRRHISYVNVTTTLATMERRPRRQHRGNCPHLVTFPWM
ncbi:MAG: hypothetical protein MUF54_04840 [Polyangiaceae bacterium]|nr:hypothetical protein [Polyangiaceae bacterium]